MSLEAQFLRKLHNKAADFVAKSLKSFDAHEIRLFSKTLSRFVETTSESPTTDTAKEGFLRSLEKDLINAQRYPNTKPLTFLQQVSRLSLTTFGSTVMGTGIRDGDLDISLGGVYQYRRSNKLISLGAGCKKELHGKLLYDVMKFLQVGKRLKVSSPVVVLSKARIPILKFTDRQHGFRCDMSVGNESGVMRSRLLSEIIKTDPMLPSLIRLVKTWARVHQLNDASRRSFGSYALTIMVLAFCCNRRVIPFFKELDPLLLLPPRSESANQCKQLAKTLKKTKPIQASVSSVLEMVLTFFMFLSLYSTREALYDGMTPRIGICCRERFVTDMSDRAGGGAVLIQDPFDSSSNCGKAVSAPMLHKTSSTAQNHTAEICAFLTCPAEERKARWQSVFRSLFGTPLRFKRDTQTSSNDQQSPDTIPEESVIMKIYDDLLEHYIQSENKTPLHLQTAAHAPWFLEKLEARVAAQLEETKRSGHSASTSATDQQSLFNLKETSVAIPVS